MARIAYRHYILILATVALACTFALRSAFVMTVTHTTILREEPTGTEHGVNKSLGAGRSHVMEGYRESSFFHGCTAYNTSRDFVSDYGWSMSVLFYSAYCLGMAIGYLAAGFILSKMAAHHLMLAGWYASAFLHFLLPVVFKESGHFALFMRFFIGIIDSVVQPALVVLTKSWAFQGEESTFLSVGFIGCYVSPVLSGFFVGACLCYISWDSSLYILAGLLLICSLLWHFVSYDSPFDCPRLPSGDIARYREEQHSTIQGRGNQAKGRAVPWRQMLTSMPVWAIWVANANKNSSMTAVTALAPLYFKNVYGFRAADSGLLLIGPFMGNTVSVLVSSYISDRLVSSGVVSVTASRKIMQCVGAMGEALFLILTIYMPDWRLSLVCLTLAQVMTGICFPGYACNAMDLTPHFSGAVTGVTSTGIFMVFVTTGVASLIPDDGVAPGGLSKWTVVFWINAAIAALSSVCYLMFASGEVQPWGLENEEEREEKVELWRPHNSKSE